MDADKTRLIKFLKKNNAFGAFLANVNKIMGMNGYGSIFKYIMPESFISHSFNFSLTPQGKDFWLHINNMWLKDCEENNRHKIQCLSYYDVIYYDDTHNYYNYIPTTSITTGYSYTTPASTTWSAYPSFNL